MEKLVLIVHYLVCLSLIVIILLQAGKGADIGAVFGGGSGTVFGSRGAATFLSKFTTGLAVVFLLTSITLASFSRIKGESSILKSVPEPGASENSAPLELESAPAAAPAESEQPANP